MEIAARDFCMGHLLLKALSSAVPKSASFCSVEVRCFTQHFNHSIIGFFLFCSSAVHIHKVEQNRAFLHGPCKFDERFLVTN